MTEKTDSSESIQGCGLWLEKLQAVTNIREKMLLGKFHGSSWTTGSSSEMFWFFV